MAFRLSVALMLITAIIPFGWFKRKGCDCGCEAE
jgi:hypothetical protein